MDLIVYKLIMEDRDTGTLYETGYKFDHSRVADDVEGTVEVMGGIGEALNGQILEEHNHSPHTVKDHTH